MIFDTLIDDSHDIKRILSDAKRTCTECLEAGHYRMTCPMLRAKKIVMKPVNAIEGTNSDSTFIHDFLGVEKYSFPLDTFKVWLVIYINYLYLIFSIY